MLSLTILVAILWLGIPKAAPAASPNQAATHSPFPDGQNLFLPGAKPDYQLYPAGNRGYVALSYQTDVNNDHRHILVQILDDQGKQLHRAILKRPGSNTVQLVHPAGAGYLLVLANQLDDRDTIYLIKIDERGQEQWSEKFPGQGVGSVASTNDQGLIVAGYRHSDATATAATGQDLCIVKLDREGNFTATGSKDAYRFTTVPELPGNQTPRHITQIFDQNGYNDGYICTGSSVESNAGGRSLHLVRLDAYGNLKWQRTYSGRGQAEGFYVHPVYAKNDEPEGYLVAGHSDSDTAGKDRYLYLLYTDNAGHKARWPGASRAIDGLAEKYYGSGSDRHQFAGLYQVPDSFKNNRKHRGEKIQGPGGYVLTALYTDSSGRRYMDLFRIDELGHDLWDRSISLPQGNLTLTYPWLNDDNVLRLIYAHGPAASQSDTHLVWHTLEHYLEGQVKEDKSLPQDDQKETNHEAMGWETKTLEFAGYTDTGKAIKKIMDLEKLPPVQSQAIARQQGEIIWPDTSVYKGQLNTGKANGEGLLVFPDGTWYQGQWQHNMFNGQGKLYLPSGENYHGSFKDHVMAGYGVFNWPTGPKYQGEFQNNMRHGQGLFTWPGGVYYEGSFENNLAHGYGKLAWPNGEKYIGEMKNGQPGGQGEYYFPSGEWYRGAFSGLAFNGIGSYHWPDGSLYVGNFAQNRFDGQGCYYWPNGVQQCGYWRNDVFLGTEYPDNFPWMK